MKLYYMIPILQKTKPDKQMHENTYKRNQLFSLDDENICDFHFLLYNLYFNFVIIKHKTYCL